MLFGLTGCNASNLTVRSRTHLQPRRLKWKMLLGSICRTWGIPKSSWSWLMIVDHCTPFGGYIHHFQTHPNDRLGNFTFFYPGIPRFHGFYTHRFPLFPMSVVKILVLGNRWNLGDDEVPPVSWERAPELWPVSPELQPECGQCAT